MLNVCNALRRRSGFYARSWAKPSLILVIPVTLSAERVTRAGIPAGWGADRAAPR